jgi:hypothetical protein
MRYDLSGLIESILQHSCDIVSLSTGENGRESAAERKKYPYNLFGGNHNFLHEQLFRFREQKIYGLWVQHINGGSSVSQG